MDVVGEIAHDAGVVAGFAAFLVISWAVLKKIYGFIFPSKPAQ